MSTNLCATASLVAANKAPADGGRNQGLRTTESRAPRDGAAASTTLSAWSQSGAKRVFDCICVVAALPMLMPMLFFVALAVRLSSRGPVLFRQKRMGRGGRLFTILKFRTLEGERDNGPGIQRFTAIGRGLRRWKLDELPQLLNVLRGDMSLVGPRPKMREYQLEDPACRPGITGAATIVFAREEDLLQRMLRLRSADTYRTVVMPTKQRLDNEYMARATFLSDLKLLVRTLLRRWDMATLHEVIGETDLRDRNQSCNAAFAALGELASLQGPALPRMALAAPAEAATDI